VKESGDNLRSTSLFGFVLLYLIVTLCSAPVLAQSDKGKGKGDKAEEKSYTLSDWGYVRLNNAHEAIGKKKYQEAMAILDEMKNRKRLPDHDRAMMWQTYGHIWAAKNKYKEGIKAFENCLAMEAMSKHATIEMMFNLGQLYLATKQFAKGIKTLESWIEQVDNPTPSAQYLIAMAYAQNKQYVKALEYANTAVSRVPKPQESWYQFLLSLNYEINKYGEVANILETLVTRYPKRTYWLQLAMMYSQLKREKQALAVFELAYLQGHLQKESEYINLASLYMSQGVPNRAAAVIEKGLDNGIVKKNTRSLRMRAEALLYARENKKARQPLEEAAEVYEKGDLYVQLAQLYMDAEEWAKGAKALNQAIKKGKLTSPGITYLLLGMVKMSQKQYSGAITAFSKASQHKRTQNSAKKWLSIAKTKMKESRS